MAYEAQELPGLDLPKDEITNSRCINGRPHNWQMWADDDPMLTKNGIVYLFETPSGHFKIGITKDYRKRWRELQVGNHEVLSFRGGTIEGDDGIDAREMERALHGRLKNYRTSGEWFKVPESELFEIWEDVWLGLAHPVIYEGRAQRGLGAALQGA